jgi:hypothetical protein
VRFTKTTKPWHVWHYWFLKTWTGLNVVIIAITSTFIAIKLHQIRLHSYSGQSLPWTFQISWLSPTGGVLVLVATWWLLTRGGHSLEIKHKLPPGWKSQHKIFHLHNCYINTETGARTRRDPRQVRLKKTSRGPSSQSFEAMQLSNTTTQCEDDCRGQWFKQGTRVRRRKAWICAVTTMALGTLSSFVGLAFIVYSTQPASMMRGPGTQGMNMSGDSEKTVERMTTQTGALISGAWSSAAVVFTSVCIRLFR